MKFFYFTLIIIVIANSAQAQTWIEQDVQSLNNINTVGFATNNTTGWVFGDSTNGLVFKRGAIYKTTNQGFSWSSQIMGSDSIKILDCHVFSTSSVIGIGKFQTTGDGAVIKTTNGGLTWARDTTSIPERLFDVEFESATYGWIVGRNGYIGKSVNSGNNWASQTSGTGEDLFSISFSSLTDGWAVGSDGGSGGIILHTTDGGSIWVTQSTTSSGDLTSVYAVNSDTAFIVGQSGLILFTSDGGMNWNSQTSGITEDLKSIVLENGLNGRAVGATGVIIQTTDGGTSWLTETSNTSNDINNLFYGENGMNWFCGDNGDVYIYAITAPNSIDELSQVKSKLYPNPANNTMYIESSFDGAVNVLIYDLSGKLILSETLDTFSSINISKINSGVYFYVIHNTEGITSSGKFIKQ